MASIRKRGSNWQARVRRYGQPDEVKSFSGKLEAETWARQVESTMEQGFFVSRAEAERILFADVIKRYIEKVTPTKRGATEETIRLNAMLRHRFTQLSMANLSPLAIAEYRDDRLRTCGAGTVVRDLVVISSIINHAKREWGIRIENPVAMVRKPRMPPGRDRVITSEEEAKLLEALTPINRRNPIMRELVIVAIETAMRRGELLRLRWEQVDLLNRTAFLPLTKNGQSRQVPLSRRAIDTLSAMPRAGDWVFPIKAAAMEANWARARDRANLPRIRFHDLRHTAATRMSGKLPNVIELAAVTGHTSLAMLKRYYHPKAHDLAIKLDM